MAVRPMFQHFHRFICIIFVSALSACGGGQTETPTPTVFATAQNIGTAQYGEYSDFQISGENLRSAYVSPVNCESMTTLGQNNGFIVVRCIPLSAAPQFIVYNSTNNAVTGTVTGSAVFQAMSITEFSSPATFKVGDEIEVVFKGSKLLSSQDYPNYKLVSDSCFVSDLIDSSSEAVTFKCYVAQSDFLMSLQTQGDETVGTIERTLPVPKVEMITTLGTIELELAANEAPATVLNFLRYVNNQYYDGTIFHRVVTGGAFSIDQGGGFSNSSAFQSNTAKAGLLAAIALERTTDTGLSNTRGTIAMARIISSNDTNTATATSQFYFNVSDNSAAFDASSSQNGFAVFGQITSGLDVIDAINAAPQSSKPTIPESSSEVQLPDPEIFITSITQVQ